MKEIKPAVIFFSVAVLIGLGLIAGMFMPQARAQSSFLSIGYVDIEEALTSHPQLETVMTQIRQFEDAKINELEEYGDYNTLTEEQRQSLIDDLYRIQEEVEAEKQRLTEPLIQDVIDATVAIGDEYEIEIILEAGSVMYGGLNLTPLILERLL